MSTRERIARHEFAVAPPWLVIPLAFLGACFLLWKPMGWLDWPGYAATAAAAVATGIFVWRRYTITVSDQSESGVTVRYARRHDD
jgi:hypothetical protein